MFKIVVFKNTLKTVVNESLIKFDDQTKSKQFKTHLFTEV